MKRILLISVFAGFVWTSHATEARVESMGSNSDYLRDETSVFRNPATAFGFGNLLVGSLGSMNRIGEAWQRRDQWFGGWAVYPLNSGIKVGLGATVNRPFEIVKTYQTLNDRNELLVHNRWKVPTTRNDNLVDFLDVLKMGEPFGNIYAFGGISLNDQFGIALGGRFAGKGLDTDSSENQLRVMGGNAGFTYKFGAHLLELGFDFSRMSLNKDTTFIFSDTSNPRVSLVVNSTDNSDVNVFLRSFIDLSKKNTLVPVVSFDRIALLGTSTQDMGIGVGFNRELYKGLVWAGAKYVYHTAEFPTRLENYTAYFKDRVESSNKFVYSFGVEKKMLWDWFTLRVGGNKVFEYLEQKDKETDDLIQKGLFERDVDAVAWGASLGTADDALRFDVTVSEEFPYSNVLAGGENGILVSRISAALKF